MINLSAKAKQKIVQILNKSQEILSSYAKRFCPTGQGGGVDPSCGSGGRSGSQTELIAGVEGQIEEAVSIVGRHDFSGQGDPDSRFSLGDEVRGSMQDAAGHLASARFVVNDQKSDLYQLAAGSIFEAADTLRRGRVSGLARKLDKIASNVSNMAEELKLSFEVGVVGV